MSLYEENIKLLEMLWQLEARVEGIRKDSPGAAKSAEKKELSARMKKIVSQLVLNITDSSGDLRKLGGALVLADLIDALKRYKDVFDIPKLDQELKKLERIWKESN